MAEDAPPEKSTKRMSITFGNVMKGFTRSAKKELDRANKQMHKGMVKAKQTAVDKIAKVPATEEDPDIISALERLKATKHEIFTICGAVRHLYDVRVKEQKSMNQLVDGLGSFIVSENDPFEAYLHSMGRGLASLEQVAAEHLKRMETEIVIPLETFRTSEVETVQIFKPKYQNGKMEYDIAAHRLTKAEETHDSAKIQAARDKRDHAFKQLTELREELKVHFRVNIFKRFSFCFFSNHSLCLLLFDLFVSSIRSTIWSRKNKVRCCVMYNIIGRVIVVSHRRKEIF